MYLQTKKIVVWALILFASSTTMYGDDTLYQEVTKRDNPIVTEKTHPILYGMVKRQAAEVNVSIPKAVKLYNARSQIVLDNGRVITNIEYLGIWVDALGDLHICKEILDDLTYEEIESLITIALAQKSCSVPEKVLITWLTSFITTCGATYLLNKRYKLQLGRYMLGDDHSLRHQDDAIKFFVMLMTVPASVLAKIVSNNTQKTIDKTAAKLIGNERVIAGIQARKNLESTYVAEGFFSRIGEALHLKGVYNTVFYPIREFTDEERIQYLSV